MSGLSQTEARHAHWLFPSLRLIFEVLARADVDDGFTRRGPGKAEATSRPSDAENDRLGGEKGHADP
jgi:hypothetical protein